MCRAGVLQSQRYLGSMAADVRSDQSAQVLSSRLLEVKGTRVWGVRKVRFRVAPEEAQSHGAAGDADVEG